MTIYVDETFDWGHIKGKWCHMACAVDDGPQELHDFAERIGLKRAWFQDHLLHPHYDLRPSKRMMAIRAGAVPVSRPEFVKHCSKFKITTQDNSESEATS